ncbi:peroxidase family protein [Planctomycetes bacterium K23_9]|uniref:Peroxidase n=1 Tax=Stieleria marina TaxID=1930275 RepID=A0A517NZJ5_9BACT|nr:peroxidase [Planctomycetes bacterium K23_9]
MRNSPRGKNRRFVKRPSHNRRLRLQNLEQRQLLAADISAFQNVEFPEDVNADGEVSPADVLMILNGLAEGGEVQITGPGGEDLAANDGNQPNNRRFRDVNGDGRLTPDDALRVLNRMTRDRDLGGRGGDQGRPPEDPTETPPENPTETPPVSNETDEVRSIDGTGNNLENPQVGAADTELLRVAENDYADGISEPAGEDRPSAREISNTLSAADPDATTSERNLSSFVFAWGQFLDHDIDLSLEPENADDAESFDIEVPEGDPLFDPFNTGEETIHLTRSAIADGTGTSTDNPAEQVNSITAWVDGSQVYGSDLETSDSLREFVGGRLLVSDDGLLPTDDDGGILAGDIRAAENVVLTSMHALFVREHNQLADGISAANPELTDEEIFQEARATVIAEMQSITYNEYLPALLGEDALSEYNGYDSSIDPSIANEFSTAAFRFGHSTLNDEFRLVGNDGEEVAEAISLASAFFTPQLLEETGIDSFLKYASSTQSQEIDLEVVDSLRNFLFGAPGSGGLDLVSLNIQRGRDHGLADYNTTREAYGLDPVESFADITSDLDVQANLESLYGDVNNVDLWVGLMAEDHTNNGSLGETATTIIADQFERLRDGDRFYYENTMSDGEIRDIESTSLADIIERNTELDSLQSNVFFFAPEITGTVIAESATQLESADQLTGNAQGELTSELDRDGGQPTTGPDNGLDLGQGDNLARTPIDPRSGARGQGVPQQNGPRQNGPRSSGDNNVVTAEGILVELVDADGTVIDSTLTDVRGNYAFASVSQSGSYQVRIADSDSWTVEGDDTWDVSISNGDENMDGIDFRVLV